MSNEPMAGEIWEDAEGCLMVFMGDGEWVVFGNCETVRLDNPMVAHPLRLAFDVFGQCAITSLRYPNGFCYGRPQGRDHNEQE